MATGDYHHTGLAVARATGMIPPEGQVVILHKASETQLTASGTQPTASKTRLTASETKLTARETQLTTYETQLTATDV